MLENIQRINVFHTFILKKINVIHHAQSEFLDLIEKNMITLNTCHLIASRTHFFGKNTIARTKINHNSILKTNRAKQSK